MHVVGGSSAQDSISDTDEQMSTPREPYELPNATPPCAAPGRLGDSMESAESSAGGGEITHVSTVEVLTHRAVHRAVAG